jgi:hypothetical protein
MLCGNFGVVPSGNLCKCHHGAKLRSANDSLDKGVLLDVGPLDIGKLGKDHMPRKKLSIQSQYIFVAPALCGVRHPAWDSFFMACAAAGSTPFAVLEKVQTKLITVDDMSLATSNELQTSLSEVLSAAAGVLKVNAEEFGCISGLGASLEVRNKRLQCDGIAYTFSDHVDASTFFHWLDFATYEVIIHRCQVKRSESMASINSARQILRVSVYQPSINVGFDCILDLGKPFGCEQISGGLAQGATKQDSSASLGAGSVTEGFLDMDEFPGSPRSPPKNMEQFTPRSENSASTLVTTPRHHSAAPLSDDPVAYPMPPAESPPSTPLTTPRHCNASQLSDEPVLYPTPPDSSWL